MNQSRARRRILITGGGAGIGATTARAAVSEGALVALLDIDGTAAERTARSLGPERALAVAGDVTDPSAVGRALDQMARRWGGIDALVNNAGIYDHAPLLELTIERWKRVFEVNVFAAIESANAAARRIEPGGAIVNISSVLGQVAAPARGPYCVSKAALIALTKMQAIEWAERGIRVNAIAPGYIDNDAVRSFEAAGGMDGSAVRRRTPLHRLGTEEEVAAGILFLLDPARAAYVTGTVLEVSGGWMAYGYVQDSGGMITGFNHTSFTVADLDRSVRFWTEALGFRAASVSERTGDWQGRLTGVPGARLRIAHLYGHGHHMELIQYLDGACPAPRIEPNRPGAAHVCLEVSDIEMVRQLLEAGATAQGEVIEITSGPVGGGKAAYIRDPNGILIELYEPHA